MKTIEICAGAGGQALGLHCAGAEHLALVEIDQHACETLRQNSQKLGLGWGEVIESDVVKFIEARALEFSGKTDLVAGGVPCPPFSKAGKQLGNKDDRDLFPAALDLVEIVKPLAVMLENVPGLMERRFTNYRRRIESQLKNMGYRSEWKLIQASHFGVSQLRPRAILVAFLEQYFDLFSWPETTGIAPPTVGEALYDLMAAGGWDGVDQWRNQANKIAPTIVGGSKKHGGPDLGPTRAKKQWHALHVNGHRVAGDGEVPSRGFEGVKLRDGSLRKGYENMPLLTLEMLAKLQGFPHDWVFTGTKTHAYRQIGNAFPPPVAEAVGRQIFKAISALKENRSTISLAAAE